MVHELLSETAEHVAAMTPPMGRDERDMAAEVVEVGADNTVASKHGEDAYEAVDKDTTVAGSAEDIEESSAPSDVSNTADILDVASYEGAWG